MEGPAGVLAHSADVRRGALATAAGAVLVWCHGAPQADSVVTDWMLRCWDGSAVDPLRGRDQLPVRRSHYP